MSANTPVAGRSPKLRVFVSTKLSLGTRKNDFQACNQEELVIPCPIQCTGAYADDDCGCARSWTGLKSHGNGTIALLVERPMTVSDLEREVFAFYSRLYEGMQVNIKKVTKVAVALVIREANAGELGKVYECRDHRIGLRKWGGARHFVPQTTVNIERHA